MRARASPFATLFALSVVTVGAAAGSSRADADSDASSVRNPCPTTKLPARSANDSFNYGNALLRVHLWPRGVLLAGLLPDGSTYATIRADGSIRAKLGWWRGVDGRLRISGVRLDASAPRLRSRVPSGYPSRGFQPSSLIFPTEGCWRVVGRVGRAQLAFVVRAVKLQR